MNKNPMKTWRSALIAMAVGCSLSAALAQAPSASPAPLQAAQVLPHASSAELLGVAQAGPRLVAVGDHGVIVYSDDQGRQWRQAQQVPFDGLLTGVSFANAQQGWAVGHAGVILHSQDGGQSWALQRSDTQADRPLYAVHFFDAQHGVAVGLWSLVLVTEDGGKSWVQQTLSPPAGAKKADLNLLSLFADAQGTLYASAERGMVLKSTDRGHSWQYLSTGYAGSFWSGLALADGTLVVAGLRGSLYRSSDGGQSWQRSDTHSKASITGLAAQGMQLVAVGMDGQVLRSTDAAQSFSPQPAVERAALTAVAWPAGGEPVLLSRSGPVKR